MLSQKKLLQNFFVAVNACSDQAVIKMENFSTLRTACIVLYWKKVPFFSLSLYWGQMSNFGVPALFRMGALLCKCGNVSNHLPTHYFASQSLPRRVLNFDGNTAWKTDHSGTTVIGFIHTAGKRSWDDCSCQSSLVWASIWAIDPTGECIEFLYQATGTTRLFGLSFSVSCQQCHVSLLSSH